MKLITEQIDLVENIIEEREGNKSFYIKGIFAQSETKNRNGRIYPKNILESQVAAFKTKIDAKTALGELNHPTGATINLDRASHLIEDLSMNGSDAIGRAKILSTPCGTIARKLMEDGVTLGVSTRGIGTVRFDKQRNANVVNEDFRLATVDIVADPSAPNAFVQGIMEGVEYYFENDMLIAKPAIVEVAEEIQEEIERKSGKKTFGLDEAKIFEKFMRELVKRV